MCKVSPFLILNESNHICLKDNAEHQAEKTWLCHKTLHNDVPVCLINLNMEPIIVIQQYQVIRLHLKLDIISTVLREHIQLSFFHNKCKYGLLIWDTLVLNRKAWQETCAWKPLRAFNLTRRPWWHWMIWRENLNGLWCPQISIIYWLWVKLQSKWILTEPTPGWWTPTDLHAEKNTHAQTSQVSLLWDV